MSAQLKGSAFGPHPYSKGEEKAFAKRVDALIGINKDMGQLRDQLTEVRAIKKAEARDVEKEIQQAIAELKPALLEAGAPIRLLSLGQLENVLPMEDAQRHQAPLDLS